MVYKNVSIIGVGFVGGAMMKSFTMKGLNVKAYDKFKEINTFNETLESDIMFLCLPTIYDDEIGMYNKRAIIETCERLVSNEYEGLVVIKSTVEPGTVKSLSERFTNLKLVHNPEFLTASTAFNDFHNQKHIVIGKGINTTNDDLYPLIRLYNVLYPDADLSLCSSTESESMKIYLNCFYSVKVQFFNEIYLGCRSDDCNFERVRELMLKNNWINPMHTKVPGTDGQLSYGGFCFPKDTNALLNHMRRNKTKHRVLEATVLERNEMRDDHVNVSYNSSASSN